MEWKFISDAFPLILLLRWTALRRFIMEEFVGTWVLSGLFTIGSWRYKIYPRFLYMSYKLDGGRLTEVFGLKIVLVNSQILSFILLWCYPVKVMVAFHWSLFGDEIFHHDQLLFFIVDCSTPKVLTRDIFEPSMHRGMYVANWLIMLRKDGASADHLFLYCDIARRSRMHVCSLNFFTLGTAK